MAEKTLKSVIEGNRELTLNEKLSFYDLVSSGCRQKNKDRLYNIIVKWFAIYDHYGIYERVYFQDEKCHYCAGQSYPDEIRNLRDCILGKG
jgi:hypothetical protein